jgi:hypothetical protein
MPRASPVISPSVVGSMCHWIGFKVVSFGVVVGLGRKLGKASADVGDGDILGHRSPPWRRLH